MQRSVRNNQYQNNVVNTLYQDEFFSLIEKSFRPYHKSNFSNFSESMSGVHQLKSGDLFALNVFLTVAEHRSFRAASILLEVTPSAVSHSVKTLERQLGVRLFNRTTRSVSLTDAGERLFTKLRPAIFSISEVMQEVGDLRDTPSGTLKINASEGAIRMVLLPILDRFLREYPRIHLDIVHDGKLSDVVADGFDAGIRLAEAVPQDMVAVRVSDEVRFAAVAAPSYFSSRPRPNVPKDLHDHECIRFRFESGSIYRWEFERDGVKEAIDVSGPLTLTDQNIMVDAAIAGIGIAFVPGQLVNEAVKDGRLERVLEEWCPAFPGLRLYYPGHRHVSSALLALISMICQKDAGT